MKVRTRYAPSPTGVPHIGGIRTALFNFLFARNQKGDFLLRIEDTDRKRLVPESLPQIKESLELLGLKWDEYYIQSKRLKIYEKYLNQLKAKGVVYEDEGAWRFKVEKGKKLEWIDGVHGKVQFASDVIEDFVIVKSDKFPTYHFANVVDDTQMEISHVLRGDEWLPSTPKHLMLYEAFGWQPPTFIHVPTILGSDHKKLSKRQGAKSALEYLEEGYLPEALINFLALLGWSPSPSEALSGGGKKEKEIFSLQELIKIFSIDRINKNSPIFNIEKLNWFNGQWIRRLDDETLAKLIQKKFPKYTKEQIIGKIPLVKERMRNISDFEKLTGFIIDDRADIGYITSPEAIKPILEKYQEISTKQWQAGYLSTATTTIIEQNQLDPREVKSNIGTAVSGSTVTPPLFESLEQVGKDKTVARIQSAMEKNQKKKK